MFHRGAAPGPAVREISDSLVVGLRLSVQPSGHKSWAVRYRFEGRTRKLTLGKWPAVALPDARDAARAALITIARGTDPGVRKAPVAALAPATVGDAVALYLKSSVRNCRTIGEIKRISRTISFRKRQPPACCRHPRRNQLADNQNRRPRTANQPQGPRHRPRILELGHRRRPRGRVAMHAYQAKVPRRRARPHPDR